MYDIETLNKIENSSNQANIFTTTQIQTTSQVRDTYENKQKKKSKFDESQQQSTNKKKKSSSVAKNIKNRQPNSYMKPLDKTKRHKVKGQDDTQNSYADDQNKARGLNRKNSNSEGPLE